MAELRQTPEEAENDFCMALSLSKKDDHGAWREWDTSSFRRAKRDALFAFRKHFSLPNTRLMMKGTDLILERFPRQKVFTKPCHYTSALETACSGEVQPLSCYDVMTAASLIRPF